MLSQKQLKKGLQFYTYNKDPESDGRFEEK